MSEELTGESPRLKGWMLLHRTRNLFFRCEDRAVSGFGLTAEQWTVLLAIKHLDDPVRPTDVGRWLGHKVNTVSMIVDRMVKAGPVKRARDLPDRRALRLVITSKGEQAFKPATAAVWALIQETLLPLTDENTRTLIRLLETLRDKALQYADSGTDTRGRPASETRDSVGFLRRLIKYSSTSAGEAKHQSGERRKK